MDIKISNALKDETTRQKENIELIASENYVSKDILALQGSILTNKYAEGYPGKRYYGGCEHIDKFESLAIEYAKKLFNCNFANVQPHSGASANMVAYRVLLEHGDKVMGLALCEGGHLTHGLPVNFSGKDYNIIPYTVDPKTEIFDYEKIREIALKEKPKMIITGATVYPRIMDFKKFREIADEIGAYLVVDMAHIAGLIAAKLHPSPFPYAHIVTSTTQKTLRGPRGGLILTNDEELAKKIDKEVFPGLQGGPFMHAIAAKAQCFYEALQPEFKTYQEQVIKNAKTLAQTMIEEGFRVISGGTDTHLLSVDVKGSIGITGKEAENILDKICITVNKNTIPNDTESPFKGSGIRLGAPAMTTRGLKEEDFKQIGLIISKALKNRDDDKTLDLLKIEVKRITKNHPIY